ncbi:MAG: transferase, partial [candidate division WOR-3 bacterium]
KYIPPFSWVSHDKIEIYEIEKAIETAKRMMERRNVIMDEEYEKRIREIFKSEVENKNNFLI